MSCHPNLSFDGRCEAALRLYEDCFHGKTVFQMTYENAPADSDAPPDWGNKIFHATFEAGDMKFSGGDQPPGRYQKPQGFAMQYNLSDPAEAERIFGLLAANGTVQMPLQETFWAARFAVVTDEFGIPWVINCEKG